MKHKNRLSAAAISLAIVTLIIVPGCKTSKLSRVSASSTGNQTLDLYLLIGQSNMSGRASIEPPEKDTINNVYLFTGTGWESAANPLNKYSTVRKSLSMQKLGPGYSFARELEKCTGKKIGLVVNARGGTSIESWEKGYKGANDYHLYEEAVKEIRKAEKYGKLKAIIWHQGEANSRRSSQYMALLKKLVKDLRHDLGGNIYFVAGQIGQWRPTNKNINQVITMIPNDIKNSDYVSTDGLSPLKGDSSNPHFDTRSQLILGERYAEKVLKNIYDMPPCQN